MAAVNFKDVLDETRLKAVFSQFDTNNSGALTPTNIVTAMKKIGHEITKGELDEIMDQHDLAKDG